ncbi:MAG: hypothetical protein Q8922_02340 [Bacteroidota bacterium]|nr:hypothetical protein [Bacteroidota bacterium]MDP4232286.1 hypothetical protein [Bacteroidota bacterium]MDP4241425.1 hypothetical protein [Bacteroidota bacterium]MDP4286751.1 hypothetical protein [Bacteroidota bacterium]
MATIFKGVNWGKGLIFNSITLVALASVLTFGFETASMAQPAQTVSYQGLLMNTSGPLTGLVDLGITYYDVGTGAVLLTETFSGVSVTKGVFELQLGSTVGGLPAMIDITRPIELGIRINQGEELSPRARLTAVPYAFTAHSLDGILASATPTNGKIFPMPLDNNGHISSNLLPPISINGMESTGGNFEIAAGPNISVQRDIPNGRLLISGTASQITGVVLGQGLIGGGSTGLITVALDAGRLPGTWITPASITGRQLSADIAGTALYQDLNGNLNVAYDPAHFTMLGDEFTLRMDVPVRGTTATFTGDVTLGSGDANMTTVLSPLSLLHGADAGLQRITSLGEPIDVTDAATKGYVDGVASTLAETLDAKLDEQLPASNLWVGNESGIAQAVTVTGDASMDAAGHLTVTGIQNIPVASAQPLGAQLLRYDAEMNRWAPATVAMGQIDGIVAGTGITVDGLDPRQPQIAVTPLTQTGAAGSVDFLNGGPAKAKELIATISNPLVTPASIIIVTVKLNGTSMANDHYVANTANVTNGSFDIHFLQTGGDLNNGEGATVHYVIFN